MPLFYQHTINEDTKLGIWRIDEGESFFLEKAPLKQDVSHPFKRRQHLAGRYLLSYLFPDFPVEEIRIADTRQPFLAGHPYHFSISHCGSFAAAVVSAGNRVGVDIELMTDTRQFTVTSSSENVEAQADLHLGVLVGCEFRHRRPRQRSCAGSRDPSPSRSRSASAPGP